MFLENTGNATKPGSSTVPHDRYGYFFHDPRATIDSHHRHTGRRSAMVGLQATLADLGYFVNGTAQYDEVTMRAVEAFQIRYFSGTHRPHVPAGRKKTDVVVDIDTIQMMHDVLAARGNFRF
jgi:N-acetyl-anhydromuramyl-L-alanine amidase AmpD